MPAESARAHLSDLKHGLVIALSVLRACACHVQSTAGSLQSLCWASAALGGVASAYFSGSLIESWGSRGVFLLTAVFPLAVSAAAVLISEQPVTSSQTRFKSEKDSASELLYLRLVHARAQFATCVLTAQTCFKGGFPCDVTAVLNLSISARQPLHDQRHDPHRHDVAHVGLMDYLACRLSPEQAPGAGGSALERHQPEVHSAPGRVCLPVAGAATQSAADLPCSPD